MPPVVLVHLQAFIASSRVQVVIFHTFGAVLLLNSSLLGNPVTGLLAPTAGATATGHGTEYSCKKGDSCLKFALGSFALSPFIGINLAVHAAETLPHTGTICHDFC